MTPEQVVAELRRRALHWEDQGRSLPHGNATYGDWCQCGGMTRAFRHAADLVAQHLVEGRDE